MHWFFRRRRSDRWCRCQVSNESPQIEIHNFAGKPASARPSLSWCLTSWMKMVQGNWHWMKSTLRHQLLGPSRSRKCKVKPFADMYDFLMCFLLLDLFDSKHNRCKPRMWCNPSLRLRARRTSQLFLFFGLHYIIVIQFEMATWCGTCSSEALEQEPVKQGKHCKKEILQS